MAESTTTPTIWKKGHCFCEAVEFSLSAKPIITNCCHCRNCQNLSGSAFSINIMIETSCIQVLSATQPVLRDEKLPDNKPSTSTATFCPICDVMLWATIGDGSDGIAFVRAGTLERNEEVVPDAHFFTRSKHPWITIPEGVLSFETLPNSPSWHEGSMERIKKARKAK